MRHNKKIKFAISALLILTGIFLTQQAIAMSNDVIKQRIETKAVESSDLNGAQVTVAVEEGFVILSGYVRLYYQKMLFEKIAWKTMGVAEVDNEIRVQPEEPVADLVIDGKIRQILKDFARFNGDMILVDVENGAVFISLSFFYLDDVQFLKHKVGKIEGVIAIEIIATLVSQHSATLDCPNAGSDSEFCCFPGVVCSQKVLWKGLPITPYNWCLSQI